ncbi:MAG: AsmA-like C-terminal domain-containing protein [Desulfobacterales bacterium]|nr:AsmA-like C-terminal domain-containing protein [Desulfobacterales bacterium]
MVIKKRLALAAAIAALIVVLLAVFAAVVVPRLLDSRSAREMIQREVSSRTGGDFTLESVQLELLPLPRLKIASPHFARGASVAARAESIVLYPRILPLLKGNVEIARLRVAGPTAELTAAPSVEAGNGAGAALSPEAAAAAFGAAIAQVKRQSPDLPAAVAGGTLILTLADGSRLRFEQIEAHLSTEAPRLELSCRSDLWDSLRVSWALDERRLPGKADITVSQLRPERIVNRLLPESGPRLTAARVDLAVEILPEKDGLPRVSFTGALPRADFQRGTERITVSADSFAGSLQPEKDRVLLVVDRWKGKSPDLELSAAFGFVRGAGGNFVLRDLRLRGTDIDAAAVKTPVLFFAGGKASLDNVFDVIRGGQVKDLTLDARIPGPQRSFAPEDFSLQGQIEDGAVHIPGIDLDLSEVAGKARIESGLLTAESVKAVHGRVSGSDGSLILSLFDDANRFELDIRVDAGLSGLAETLARMIEAPSFTRGVEAIQSLDGRAQGRLFLGQTLDDIRPRVVIDRISAEASVSFLPGPVAISGSGIEYSGESISAAALDLGAEGIRIEKISGFLAWEKALRIEAEAASVSLRIDPVMTLLPQLASLAGQVPEATLSGGEIRLSEIRWRGPVFSPAQWDYDARGTLRSAQVESDRLPAPVRVSVLAFHARPRLLSLQEFQIAFLDAALSGSGSLQGPPHAAERAELRLEGKIGPEADRWLLAQSRIPSALTLQVHQVSDARVQWIRDGALSVSGHLLLNRDTRVSVDLERGLERFDLKRLSIEDPDSKAEASFRRTPSALEFTYNGRLSSTTVDGLIRNNDLLGGWIMGGLRARIDLDSPGASEIEGRLEVEKLTVPLEEGPRIRVAKASLYGEAHRLDVERLDIRIDDDPFEARGEVFRREGGFGVNGSISAARIDLNRWRQALFPEARQAGKEQPAAVRIPVDGSVRIDAGTVLYEEYRFEEVSAEVQLFQDRTEVSLEKGKLCGISVPAEVTVFADSTALQVRPMVTDGQLAQASRCLLGDGGQMEGRFSLNGSISGRGSAEELIPSLSGNLNFSAREGRIRENAGFGILKQVLALVNVTEIFAGALPDFSRNGFRYNSIKASSEIEEGVLRFTEVVIDGRNMNLTAQGDVDLADRRLNMTVLVAPLKTVDRIVGKIPLVGDILEGTLISIPVRVRGTLDKPEVNFIPPSMVGKGLIGITERTLKLPLKLIYPGTR